MKIISIREFFSEEISPEIVGLAKKRLLYGGTVALRGCDRARVKLVLLLVREMNPEEVLSMEEAAVLYGISASAQSAGSMPRGVNVGK